MAFTSVSFVFLFLPVSIILYYLLPKIAYKNILLVILSLFFYAWGDKNFKEKKKKSVNSANLSFL